MHVLPLPLFIEASYTVQEIGANSYEVCVTMTEGQLERDGQADIIVMATETSNVTGQRTLGHH